MGRGKARPGSGHRVQRSGYKSKLHQESERARPSERLRQEGNIDFDDRRQVADIILSQVHATADRVSFEWKI